MGEPGGCGGTLLHGGQGEWRKRCLYIGNQGLSVPAGGLSGSRLSPAQESGPGVGQDPDWLCLKEKRGPCQGSLSAVQ